MFSKQIVTSLLCFLNKTCNNLALKLPVFCPHSIYLWHIGIYWYYLYVTVCVVDISPFGNRIEGLTNTSWMWNTTQFARMADAARKRGQSTKPYSEQYTEQRTNVLLNSRNILCTYFTIVVNKLWEKRQLIMSAVWLLSATLWVVIVQQFHSDLALLILCEICKPKRSITVF
jgi:hypothetical protein